MMTSCLLACIDKEQQSAFSKTKSTKYILIGDWGRGWVLALATAGGWHQVVERRRVTVDMSRLDLLSKGRNIKDLSLPLRSVTGTEPEPAQILFILFSWSKQYKAFIRNICVMKSALGHTWCYRYYADLKYYHNSPWLKILFQFRNFFWTICQEND